MNAKQPFIKLCVNAIQLQLKAERYVKNGPFHKLQTTRTLGETIMIYTKDECIKIAFFEGIWLRSWSWVRQIIKTLLLMIFQ